jgi:hypothetical protein
MYNLNATQHFAFVGYKTCLERAGSAAASWVGPSSQVIWHRTAMEKRASCDFQN